MKKEQLIDMIGEAPGEYVRDAAEYRKKRRLPGWSKWIGGIAAALALVLLVTHLPGIPQSVSAVEVSAASESRKMKRPKNGADSDLFDEWMAHNEKRRETVSSARTPIADFAGLLSGDILSGTDDCNRVWSPVNAYIALAMTAELTGGETQAELLNVLGAEDLPELRGRISAVWEDVYGDDGKEISTLANSLWLDEDVEYVQEKMDSLAYDYYASVYQGDLGSEQTEKAMNDWMRAQTGGLLGDRKTSTQLEPQDRVLAIASTVYLQSKWVDEFDEKLNQTAAFHAVTGDVERTFMNRKEAHMNYYWGEDFGAVSLYLKNGSSMWFILPDEDKTVGDVLERGEYMELITRSSGNADADSYSKWSKVNLSIPKFDVTGGVELREPLQKAGLTRIFQQLGNDFSPSIRRANAADDPVFLDSIHQDTRVKIDEKGVSAVSYIELNFGAGAAAPPDEVIDFALDRPFVFAVTKDEIPLFVGTVNLP